MTFVSFTTQTELTTEKQLSRVESYAGVEAFGLGLRGSKRGPRKSHKKLWRFSKDRKNGAKEKGDIVLTEFEDPLELNDLHYSLFQLSGRRLRREVKGGKKRSKFVK